MAVPRVPMKLRGPNGRTVAIGAVLPPKDTAESEKLLASVIHGGMWLEGEARFATWHERSDLVRQLIVNNSRSTYSPVEYAAFQILNENVALERAAYWHARTQARSASVSSQLDAALARLEHLAVAAPPRQDPAKPDEPTDVQRRDDTWLALGELSGVSASEPVDPLALLSDL